MSNPPEPVDLIEACRAQIAACRELAYARQLLEMAGTGPDHIPAYTRYLRALAAARDATKVSDAAQAYAWQTLDHDMPGWQPELPL